MQNEEWGGAWRRRFWPFCILQSSFCLHPEVALLALCGSLVDALGSHWGGFGVATAWLSTRIGVALMSHWGGFPPPALRFGWASISSRNIENATWHPRATLAVTRSEEHTSELQ